MTGPEHYREGERLLGEAPDLRLAFNAGEVQSIATLAQAHFLAAFVAATAQAHLPEYVSWQEVISQ